MKLYLYPVPKQEMIHGFSELLLFTIHKSCTRKGSPELADVGLP